MLLRILLQEKKRRREEREWKRVQKTSLRSGEVKFLV
jgi:hypothetical protein